jgi:hypothetical protein
MIILYINVGKVNVNFEGFCGGVIGGVIGVIVHE